MCLKPLRKLPSVDPVNPAMARDWGMTCPSRAPLVAVAETRGFRLRFCLAEPIRDRVP
jgi:hypothetical protein